MKGKLFLLAMTLILYFVSGQITSGNKQIDTSKIKPWIPKQTQDFQSEYNFGYSEHETYFVLIISKDSCYAQIKSGESSVDSRDFIWDFENLENVKIVGNKFYSNRTNGEFVKYKNRTGLIIYKP